MGYAQHRRDFPQGVHSKLAGQHGSGVSAQLNAALGAGSVVWSLRYPESATNVLAITRLIPKEGCTVAFTSTGIVLGRGLSLVRASAPVGTPDPSGGNAWSMVRAHSGSSETVGVGRVSSGAALTTTGFVKESDPLKRFLFSGGTVNSNLNLASVSQFDTYSCDGWGAEPIYLTPGQALFWQANADFDAAGNWFFECSVDGFELP